MAVKDDFKKVFNNIEKVAKNIQKSYAKKGPKILEKAILKSMDEGKSPVRGKTWATYSESYKKAIRAGRYAQFGKNITPVNLELSGVMKDSLDVTTTRTGEGFAMEAEFTDEVAKFHNDLGAGQSKTIRRLLPTNIGEKFNLKISKKLDNLFEKIVSKETKKFNN